MTLTFGSVCSGIEAASEALEDLGWQPLWFAEIEPFPCAVLAYHHPQVPNLGDMTTIAARILAGEVPAPDVLIGGTPCQAFSVAGLRQGLRDPRGGLTLAFVELAHAIDTVRRAAGLPPVIIWWENVPGVLSDTGNAFGCFLAALVGSDEPLVHPDGSWPSAGVVLGPIRELAWRSLDAQYVDLAQRRERVFVIASAGAISPVAVLFESEGVQRHSPPSRSSGEGVAGTLRRGAGGGCGPGPDEARQGLLHIEGPARALTGGGRKAGGFSEDDIPHVAVFGGNNRGGAIEVAPALNAKGGSGRMDFESEALCVTGPITHALKAEGADASEDGTGRGTPIVAIPFDTTQITSRANYSRPADGDPCHPLAAGAHPPAVCLHGTQDPGVSEIAHALGRNQGRENALIAGWAVRRFTPNECEALQGFRKNHTRIPTWTGWRKLGDDETPEQLQAQGLEVKQNKKTGRWRVKDVDGPRYKAIGNSMAVNVMRWIGRRIDRVRGAA